MRRRRRLQGRFISFCPRDALAPRCKSRMQMKWRDIHSPAVDLLAPLFITFCLECRAAKTSMQLARQPVFAPPVRELLSACEPLELPRHSFDWHTVSERAARRGLQIESPYCSINPSAPSGCQHLTNEFIARSLFKGVRALISTSACRSSNPKLSPANKACPDRRLPLFSRCHYRVSLAPDWLFVSCSSGRPAGPANCHGTALGKRALLARCLDPIREHINHRLPLLLIPGKTWTIERTNFWLLDIPYIVVHAERVIQQCSLARSVAVAVARLPVGRCELQQMSRFHADGRTDRS